MFLLYFAVPRPVISRFDDAPAVLNFGEPLTLTCDVTTVRGITSGLIIIWSSQSLGEVRRVENVTGNVVDSSVFYRDQLNISSLTTDDTYTCRAFINSTSQQPQGAFSRSILIQLTCKCYHAYTCKRIVMYILGEMHGIVGRAWCFDRCMYTLNYVPLMTSHAI